MISERLETIMSQSRTGLLMNEQDLCELYTYLALFHKVYSVCDRESESLQKAVVELYKLQAGIEDEKIVLKALRNPRNAGRKKAITTSDCNTIMQMRKEGMTIREIAEKTGISRSSVQRALG